MISAGSIIISDVGNGCENWERLRERLWIFYFYKCLIIRDKPVIFAPSRND